MATQEASNDEKDHTPRTFTCVFLVCQDHRVRLKGVFVEKDSKVRVANARNELIGDARNMITGFLNNNRMELSTSRRDDVSRVPARQVWIQLTERKKILMMYEIAVGSINVTLPIRFGLTKFDQRTRARGLGKRPLPARGSAPTRLWVPAITVLALLLQVVTERTGCVSTWVVLTNGCGSVTEIAVHRRGRTGAALTNIPCEAC